jgi:hypothetical protein
MTGLQLLASCVMSFFVPGLGQMYQATYDVSRRDLAVKMVIAAGICLVLSLGIVGILFMACLWLYSLGECVVYAFNHGGVPAPSSRTATAIAIALAALCFGSVAQAQQLPTTEFDQSTNTFHEVWPADDGSASLSVTLTPGEPEPCCVCTKLNPCEKPNCKHGRQCNCCKTPKACATSGSCCDAACSRGGAPRSCCRPGAGSVNPGRRFLFKRSARRGCRSCR